MVEMGKRLLRYTDGILLLGSILGFSSVGDVVGAPICHLWSLIVGVEDEQTVGSVFPFSFIL